MKRRSRPAERSPGPPPPVPFEATELTPESTPPGRRATRRRASPRARRCRRRRGRRDACRPHTRPEHPRRAAPRGGSDRRRSWCSQRLPWASFSRSAAHPRRRPRRRRKRPSGRCLRTGSPALGQVSVRLVGNKATVSLTTNGLDGDAELVHAMHIHAGGKGECPPASAAKLHNGHLAIDTNDGIAFYGPPVTSLTTSGNTSVASILVFKRYPVGRHDQVFAHDRTAAQGGRRDPRQQRRDRDPRHRLRRQRQLHRRARPQRPQQAAVRNPDGARAVRAPDRATSSSPTPAGGPSPSPRRLHPTRVTAAELSICGLPLPENGADTRRRVPGGLSRTPADSGLRICACPTSRRPAIRSRGTHSPRASFSS